MTRVLRNRKIDPTVQEKEQNPKVSPLTEKVIQPTPNPLIEEPTVLKPNESLKKSLPLPLKQITSKNKEPKHRVSSLTEKPIQPTLNPLIEEPALLKPNEQKSLPLPLKQNKSKTKEPKYKVSQLTEKPIQPTLNPLIEEPTLFKPNEPIHVSLPLPLKHNTSKTKETKHKVSPLTEITIQPTLNPLIEEPIVLNPNESLLPLPLKQITSKTKESRKKSIKSKPIDVPIQLISPIDSVIPETRVLRKRTTQLIEPIKQGIKKPIKKEPLIETNPENKIKPVEKNKRKKVEKENSTKKKGKGNRKGKGKKVNKKPINEEESLKLDVKEVINSVDEPVAAVNEEPINDIPIGIECESISNRPEIIVELLMDKSLNESNPISMQEKMSDNFTNVPMPPNLTISQKKRTLKERLEEIVEMENSHPLLIDHIKIERMRKQILYDHAHIIFPKVDDASKLDIFDITRHPDELSDGNILYQNVAKSLKKFEDEWQKAFDEQYNHYWSRTNQGKSMRPKKCQLRAWFYKTNYKCISNDVDVFTQALLTDNDRNLEEISKRLELPKYSTDQFQPYITHSEHVRNTIERMKANGETIPYNYQRIWAVQNFEPIDKDKFLSYQLEPTEKHLYPPLWKFFNASGHLKSLEEMVYGDEPQGTVISHFMVHISERNCERTTHLCHIKFILDEKGQKLIYGRSKLKFGSPVDEPRRCFLGPINHIRVERVDLLRVKMVGISSFNIKFMWERKVDAFMVEFENMDL